MDPATLGVLIPVIAVGGFFGWMIALAVSKAYMAKLKAQGTTAPAAGQEELRSALDELRREVAELAERLDFAERLLAQSRDGERLGPPR
jgi:hypothetical protein